MIKLTDLLDENENPCWKGYKQVGMKQKDGREVPNCVPESVNEESPKIKNKISKKDWSKIAKFNKHIGQDGTHYIMKYDDKIGTYLQAVIVEQNDGVYFKSYTAAIEAARAAALKRGFEIDDDELFTKVGVGSKKPSVGKTTRVSLALTKAGRPQRKMLHIQVYGMNNGYELNSYIN